MKTIKQISEDLNLKIPTIRERFKKHGMIGRRRGLDIFYTDEQIKKISYKKGYKQMLPLFSKAKSIGIYHEIINSYLNGMSYSEIANYVNLKYDSVYAIIFNFKRNNNFLIIQSKMNFVK